MYKWRTVYVVHCTVYNIYIVGISPRFGTEFLSFRDKIAQKMSFNWAQRLATLRSFPRGQEASRKLYERSHSLFGTSPNVHYTVYTVQCTVYSAQYTLTVYSAQCQHARDHHSTLLLRVPWPVVGGRGDGRECRGEAMRLASGFRINSRPITGSAYSSV